MTRPPTPYAPPPPPRPRPSAWWFGLGIALVLGAVAAAVGIFWWTLTPLLHTDAEVPRDGRPHVVELSSDGDQMLWTYDFEAEPVCHVVDLGSGDEVALRAPGGEFRRDDGGTAGDRVGTWRFDPRSTRVEVTCTSAGGQPPSTVEIGAAPRIRSFVLGLLATIFVPLLLGLAGVAVLLVTGILWSLRPARPGRSAA